MEIKKTTVGHICQLIGGKIIGNSDQEVTGLNEIHRVTKGDIVFVDHPKYYDKALNSLATIILINKDVPCPKGKSLIVIQDPFAAFNRLVKYFQPSSFSNSALSSTAVIGKNTVLMHGVVIGNHVTIGKNCIIHPNVVIYDYCEIGDDVIIHSNSTVGSDAFYYKKRTDNFERLESGGKVIIANGVEIGANCTIDKGVSAVTYVGKGTKIDNHVHVGHDTVIGEMCLFAAQVGIAGVVTIGDNVTLWGQVGVSSNIKIANNVVVYAQSGVGNDLEEGKAYFGSPCREAKEVYREMLSVRQLPGFLEKFNDIDKS